MRIILLCLFLLGGFPQPKSTAEETVTSQPYAFDFGRIKEGEVLKHDFVLKNDSGKTLNIKNVNTSCGCTVSKVGKKALRPGEDALIEVEFDSKGYSGTVQQFVYVNTDSLDNPVIRYIIKAEVVKQLE